jgi:hypothetical protein
MTDRRTNRQADRQTDKQTKAVMSEDVNLQTDMRATGQDVEPLIP